MYVLFSSSPPLLLPPLTLTLTTYIHSTHNHSVLQIISHIMMRCKSNFEITLPVDNIFDLLYDPTKDELNKVHAFTLNFALAFLELGLPRHKDKAVSKHVLPCLIHLLEASPPTSNQSAQISHMLLEWIKTEPAARSADDSVAKAVAKGEERCLPHTIL